MSDDPPEPDGELPPDLAAVVALAAAAVAAVALPVVRDSPLRVALGLVLVLVLPGYAVVAALFPERGPAGEAPERRQSTEPDEPAGPGADGGSPDAPDADRLLAAGGIDGVERAALSVGVSVAVVPLLGLALAASPVGLRTGPVVVSVASLSAGAVAVAARRRRALPPDERFAVPVGEWAAAARSGLVTPDSRADLALNLLLAASVVAAAASVGYAVAGPERGQGFTELYLLAENETGALVADDYPTEFERGEPRSLVVGVGNHEGRAVEYTVVVLLQEVSVAGNATTVRSERELERFRPRVPANGTWHRRHAVAPTATGTDLRLTYLLYRGAAPADPSVDGAYREVHLWVDVSRGNRTVVEPSRGTGR